MNRPVLELRGVGFGYGAPVLSRLDLTLPRGSFSALLGRSGCGKSTLLNVAAGLIAPDEGAVLFLGREVRAPSRRAMIIYQEQDQLFPWKRLLGNVALPLTVGPGRVSRVEAEEQAFEALKKVGLHSRCGAFPHELSGGMKQRAVLARALAAGAELLLFDEPFASLDAFSREELQELLIRTWKENGLTILFVTHDIREAVRLGEVLLFMDDAGTAAAGAGAGQLERRPLGGAAPRDPETPEAAELVRAARERLRPGRG